MSDDIRVPRDLAKALTKRALEMETSVTNNKQLGRLDDAKLMRQAAIYLTGNTKLPMPSMENNAYEYVHGSSVCPMCGIDTPHQHSPLEVVIYRNGYKYGIYLAAPLAAQDEQPYFDYNAVHGIPAAQPDSAQEAKWPEIFTELAELWEVEADKVFGDKTRREVLSACAEEIKLALVANATHPARPMDTMVLYATRYLWLKNECLNSGAKARLKILYRLEDSEWTTVSELDELDSFINQMYSAAFFPHPPQPVTPVEGKVTDEMIERARLALLSEMGTVECCRQTYMDIPDQDAMRAVLEAALGQPVDAQGDGERSDRG